ncbi:MAG: serine/threonine-protein kinase [Egibacteraceae bacterium]
MTAWRTQGFLLDGRYRLVSPIGRGGMGTVWYARDVLLDRDVAVKEVLLPPELDDQERELLCRRAIREARAAARLSHPNVVTVYDVLEYDGRPWIVMQLIRARSLADVVHEDGPLPPRRVAAIGLEVLNALSVAHAAGVFHRDVKPSNILLGQDGRVVLTDFGIANVEGDPSLTATGLLLGAPAYMAPERALGRPAGAMADLWSLGATLYTAVEGRPPYDADSPMLTLAAVVTQDPAPPQRAGPLKPVLEGLLRKDPAVRLNAANLWLLLRDVALGAAEEPESPLPPPPPDSANRVSDAQRTRRLETVGARPGERARRPSGAWLPAVLVTLAALTAGLLGLAAQQPLTSDPPPPSPAPAEPPAQSPVANELPEAVRQPPAEASSSEAVASEEPRTEASSGEAAAVEEPRTGVASGEVPDGFAVYEDPTGFSVAIPAGWEASREGRLFRLREPGSARFLLVDQTDDPQPDPVADWERQEASRRGTYDDYERVRIEAVDYFRAAADWEFTYATGNGRVHVLNRGFVTGDDKAYALYWSTPDPQWDDSLDLFEVFARTFQPAQ